jgi:hypothetical protein
MANHDEPLPDPIIHEKPADSVLDLEKSREIREACQDADIEALVKLSSSKGGLLHDDLRKQACRYPFRLLMPTILYVLKLNIAPKITRC